MQHFVALLSITMWAIASAKLSGAKFNGDPKRLINMIESCGNDGCEEAIVKWLQLGSALLKGDHKAASLALHSVGKLITSESSVYYLGVSLSSVNSLRAGRADHIVGPHYTLPLQAFTEDPSAGGLAFVGNLNLDPMTFWDASSTADYNDIPVLYDGWANSVKRRRAIPDSYVRVWRMDKLMFSDNECSSFDKNAYKIRQIVNDLHEKEVLVLPPTLSCSEESRRSPVTIASFAVSSPDHHAFHVTRVHSIGNTRPETGSDKLHGSNSGDGVF
jgi:hypothetical protein